MSLRKVSFHALLASILSLAATVTFNRHVKEFSVQATNAWVDAPSSAANFAPKNQALPADFLSVQSKSAKGLGVGKVLAASRNLGDPNFAKTVILLARYDEHGVLGLILNRRTDVPLSRVLESLKAAKDRTDKVYVGGPMEMPAVFALFQSPAKLEGAEHVFDSVYLIAAKSLFEQTISAQPKPEVFHVYLGYAGWTQEQLQKEVELGAWFVFPAETGTVFNADPDSLWQEMIRKTEMQLARSEHSPWRIGEFEDKANSSRAVASPITLRTASFDLSGARSLVPLVKARRFGMTPLVSSQ
jgi:putative transcriptional regulator